MTTINDLRNNLLSALLKRRRIDLDAAMLDRQIDTMTTQISMLEAAAKHADADQPGQDSAILFPFPPRKPAQSET